MIPYHLPRYKKVIELCKSESPSSVSCSDLTFATRFIATFLSLRVKGTRPMTYQLLAADMFEGGKRIMDTLIKGNSKLPIDRTDR